MEGSSDQQATVRVPRTPEKRPNRPPTVKEADADCDVEMQDAQEEGEAPAAKGTLPSASSPTPVAEFVPFTPPIAQAQSSTHTVEAGTEAAKVSSSDGARDAGPQSTAAQQRAPLPQPPQGHERGQRAMEGTLPSARPDLAPCGPAERAPTGETVPSARTPSVGTSTLVTGPADAMDISVSQEEDSMNVDTEDIKQGAQNITYGATGAEFEPEMSRYGFRL